jgi:hypothetical protein
MKLRRFMQSCPSRTKPTKGQGCASQQNRPANDAFRFVPIVPLTRRSKKRHYSITSSARLRWPPRKHHVRVLPDHGVAFTRNVLERRAVEDLDVTAVVMDEAGVP